MNPTHAALRVIAKMALSDGKISPEERELLEELTATLAGENEIDTLIADVATQSLEELTASVEKYEDRFFIALRAYSMAHVDNHFDAEEEKLYERLIDSFEITTQDRQLIRRCEALSRAPNPQPPEGRVAELFERSSFAC